MATEDKSPPAVPAANPHLYALVAGEPSGDALGAGLMMALLRHDPQAQFIGIGGPKMIACGMHSAFDMATLAVMGITEVVGRLLPILRIRLQLTKIVRTARPAVFIGIDLPDFNLALERRLRQHGIKTVHYVSPSVWAWRQGRMKLIAEACDLVLSLLPFEKAFYDERRIPCEYVGHMLANRIPEESDEVAARERIDVYRTSVEPVGDKIMGILPGSRSDVIRRMLPVYVKTARLIKKRMPKLCFLSTVPSRELAEIVKNVWLENGPDLSLTVYVGGTRDVIAACNAVLLTSGTVALETMLLKRPFAVAYKVSPVTAALVRRLLKVSQYSLPNLIAGRTVVNEFIQERCTPERLADEMLKLLTSDNLLMKKEFAALHRRMRRNSDELAAQAVLRVISAPPAAEPSLTVPQDAELGLSGKTEPKFGMRTWR